MRWPNDLTTAGNPDQARTEPSGTVNRDPSYPDRARIDSDVRAFLRPASSPWIVFDRDSRVDDFARSALRVGAVFASSPSLRSDLDKPSAGGGVTAFEPGGVLGARSSVPAVGMFPTTHAADPVVEPSNLVVASDLLANGGETDAVRKPLDTLEMQRGLTAGRRRAGYLAGAACAVVAIVAITALAQSKSPRHAKRADPVAVDLPPAAAAPGAPATEETREGSLAPPSESEPATTVVKANADASPATKRLGKLTIKPDPKTKNVWFDGKRMLGAGTRTFLVACGMHTVAINDKNENKDVEIPCNGELVVGGK